jgi:phage/plasmid-like protein (TIGR03299 family)
MMAANIGEMFYTGETPWHGEGIHLAKPATVEEALKVGGLNWEVGKIDLMTADDPPCPILQRKALVRLDLPAGDAKRVLGVAYPGFSPLQNKDGAMIFDAIFGQGKPVYNTGGYLGNGEKVWLLAKIDKTLKIGGEDIVEPYALFANSHDGSMAFNIQLTTVRVVCQNTLSIALREKKFGKPFRRAHKGSFFEHAQAAQEFFAETLKELDFVADSFTVLSNRTCNDKKFQSIIELLLPDPKKPRNADKYPGLLKAYESKLKGNKDARKEITRLREEGKGMKMDTCRGTFWGVLNAVLEYVDHYKETKGSKLGYSLLGEGMNLKVKAFGMVRDEAAKAA